MSRKPTPEQLAARRQRQFETSAMTKCACGNVAPLGQMKCGRCDDLERARELVHDQETRVHLMLEWFDENREKLDRMLGNA